MLRPPKKKKLQRGRIVNWDEKRRKRSHR
jgi:hypothetical protein